MIQFLTKHWIRCWSSDEASDVIDHVTLFSPRLGPVFLKLCDWLVPELQLQTSRHRSQRGFETIWLICTGTPAGRPPHRLNTSQTGRELSSRYSQHTTAHIVFIQWMHLIIIIFFLHHIAAASHVISDYNSFHHQVSVCQEPQAAYYSITLLYIGCWQLNTWIHERREHSKWTSKSKKPKNYKKKKNRETRNIRKLYDWMCLM